MRVRARKNPSQKLKSYLRPKVLAKLFDEWVESSSPLMILGLVKFCAKSNQDFFSLSGAFFCFSNVGIFDQKLAEPVEICDLAESWLLRSEAALG